MTTRKQVRKIIRKPFGDSNRKGHLKMSQLLSGFLVGMAIHDMSWFWAVAAIGCILQEYWATADRDIEDRRKCPCPYWVPYAKKVKHRALLSHGFILGTMARFIYGYAPVLALWFSTAWTLPLWPVGAFLLGAFINDLGHSVLDL